jgi:hypothetical protein
MPIPIREQDYGGDSMPDPRVSFPVIMLLVGIFVIAGSGIALQSRGARREY